MCYTYLIFLHDLHQLNNLVPARNKSIYPLLVPVWILYSLPLFHFFSNLVISPHTFSTVGIFEGSKEVENSGARSGLYLLPLLLLTAIELSLGVSSLNTSTNKTNKNIHKRKNTKNTVQTIQNTVNSGIHIMKTPTHTHRTAHMRFVIASCVSTLLCGHELLCWRTISATFCEVKPSWNTTAAF